MVPCLLPCLALSERPGPPQSIKLVDVWGSNATLEWTPPQDTGNTALLGYTLQKADTKSGVRPAGREWGERNNAFWNGVLVALCSGLRWSEFRKQGSHSRHLLGTPKLWFTVLERYHRTSFTVSNLIVGNSYAFRVFAENQCGLSETAPITADLAHIQKAGRTRGLGAGKS